MLNVVNSFQNHYCGEFHPSYDGAFMKNQLQYF